MKYPKNILMHLVLTIALMIAGPAIAETNMIKPEHLKQFIIEPTLAKMEAQFPGAANPAAADWLVGVQAHESTIGNETYLVQDGGPALGIYQVEPATHDDVWKNFLAFRPQPDCSLIHSFGIYEANYGAMSVDDPLYHQSLIASLPYATAIARLVVYRQNGIEWPAPDHSDPDAEEDYIRALGQIWKDHYNTAEGAGTVEQYVEAYPRVFA